MDNTIWSIVPPVLAIIMVLLTKRVLVSLGVGIIASALFITRFNLFKSWGLIWQAFTGVFVEDGGMNTWKVYIILFVLIIGVLTAFVSMMVGARALGDWKSRRLKARTGA